jgi:serpin B
MAGRSGGWRGAAAGGIAACLAAAVVAIVLVATATTAVGSTEVTVAGVARPTLDADAAKQMARAEQGFALALLSDVVQESTSANEVLSPLSADAALTMTDFAASGSTEAQLAHALGITGVPPATLEAAWTTIATNLAADAVADHVSFSDVNAIWTQRGFPVRSTFLRSLERGFASGVWQTNFVGAAAQAAAAINAWVAAATNGAVKNLVTPGAVDPAAATILNATVFQGAWAADFSNAGDASFAAPTGSVSVPYFGGILNGLSATSDHGATAVELPYRGTGPTSSGPSGLFSALIVMPNSGSLSSYLSTWSAAGLTAVSKGMTDAGTNVAIPLFSVETNTSLVTPLQAMGVTDLFTRDADLARFSAQPTFVGTVDQQAVIVVNESGTSAAAATAVVVLPTLAFGQTIRIDRPFLFLVRNATTGAIVFAAAVTNPLA